MKKKTPSRSKGKNKVKDKGKEKIVVLVSMSILVLILVTLFYYIDYTPSNDNIVAKVNSIPITSESLNLWYKSSILPEFRNVVTKEAFLQNSLIPQEVLMQEAIDKGIDVSDEELENYLGLYIIDSGLQLGEFEDNLRSNGISLDEIKNSFKVRLTISRLLEEEGFAIENQYEFIDGSNLDIQDYITSLIDRSNIELIERKMIEFDDTQDPVCGKKPIVRFYSTSTCSGCDKTAEIFKDSLAAYQDNIDAAHWVLDIGDNQFTVQNETGIPREELALFKKYSPENDIPLTVIGCKFKKIGNYGNDQELSQLIGSILN
jgi:thiol-disulfide isomerase/thioredoxin